MFNHFCLLLLAACTLATAAPTDKRCARCTLATNSNETCSTLVVGERTSTTGQPIYQVIDVDAGVTIYVTQTGVSPITGQPVYTATNEYDQVMNPAPALATTSTCSGGTLVTISDGTRSCVVEIGQCPSGYPIYKVTNSGVVTYVSQTGVSATGMPIMTVTNKYCYRLTR